MKCPKCGKEYSHSVLPLHMNRCKVEEEKKEEYTLEELQEKAIELKIASPSVVKRWKIARLKKELEI